MDSMIKVDVLNLETTGVVGQTEMTARDWSLYEAGNHPDYDSTNGAAKAIDVLDAEQIAKAGISIGTAVYLEK